MSTTKRLAGLGALVSLFLIAGCRFLGSTPTVRLADDPGTSAGNGIIVPEVVNSDLDRTARRLAAAGLSVVVRRPAAEFERKGKEAVTLPEIVRPFRPSEWNHMIAHQEPAAGTTLQAGGVITLTAGMHHGAGPFGRWLGTHRFSVAVRGETRCRDCHPQSYCSDCHGRP